MDPKEEKIDSTQDMEDENNDNEEEMEEEPEEEETKLFTMDILVMVKSAQN
jgi:signal recognition particle subunit SRP68